MLAEKLKDLYTKLQECYRNKDIVATSKNIKINEELKLLTNKK